MKCLACSKKIVGYSFKEMPNITKYDCLCQYIILGTTKAYRTNFSTKDNHLYCGTFIFRIDQIGFLSVYNDLGMKPGIHDLYVFSKDYKTTTLLANHLIGPVPNNQIKTAMTQLADRFYKLKAFL